MVFGIVQSAGNLVLGRQIHLMHLVKIRRILIDHSEFGKHRHAHLQGINPKPVVLSVRIADDPVDA